uniref:carbonic anhydrase n=1 Tax=Alexandrium monilatum TaxID=311494 RepID=A0A7S4QAF5_9DINO|mmetsp:Transcript_97090/g.307981  ORF Transcript_97090/g.307981 Transcript_97090/m.307981 type:complete len:436 (-) Transcript_97090:78-1385(-)
MARTQDPLALAVVLIHGVCCSRVSLRQVHKAPSTGFGDLVECQVAYDRLEDQCSRSPPQTAERGSGGRSGGLVHDAEGGIIVNAAAPNEPPAYKRIPYRPPETMTGRPNEVSGWDYRLHGEDWEHLGKCGGPNQSPVDLPRYVDVQGQTKSLLWFDYYVDPDLKPSKVAHLMNDGHGLRYDVQLNGVDLGLVKIGGREYTASEYVFHAPSEHSLDGAIFPLELQIYHSPQEGEGGVAVAIFFREGPSNAFLAALRDSMRGVAPTWNATQGSSFGSILGRFPAAFDLEAVLPRGDAAAERSFYNYMGSSTQPPCTPGINWWVLSVPLTATREEIRVIRRALYASPSMRHGNARSAMPLGSRSVSAALVGFQNALKPSAVRTWSDLDEAKNPRGYSSQDIPWGPHWQAERSPSTSSASPWQAAAPGPAPVSEDAVEE